jgi:hypothetical protein
MSRGPHSEHQALIGKQAHSFARSFPRYAVLLHQRRLARDGPPWRELAGLDPSARDRCDLLVNRLGRVVVDGHERDRT